MTVRELIEALTALSEDDALVIVEGCDCDAPASGKLEVVSRYGTSLDEVVRAVVIARR